MMPKPLTACSLYELQTLRQDEIAYQQQLEAVHADDLAVIAAAQRVARIETEILRRSRVHRDG